MLLFYGHTNQPYLAIKPCHFRANGNPNIHQSAPDKVSLIKPQNNFIEIPKNIFLVPNLTGLDTFFRTTEPKV